VLHAINVMLVASITAGIYESLAVKSRAAEGRDFGCLWAVCVAGLLYGVHPLRVESVAWVTERKDVLNGFFSLGAILCYLKYAKKQQAGDRPKGRVFYLASIVLFTLSLMAKSISVVMPALLLVIDWYPLRRMQHGTMRQVLLEKIPFIALSCLMIGITFLTAAQSAYLASYEAFPLGERLRVSGNALWEYCRLMVLPVSISPYHIIPDPLPASYAVMAAVMAVCCIAVLACVRRLPWLTASGLLFILPLLPVLALFQNGGQSFADRFTYLPAIAPSIAVAICTGRLWNSLAARQKRILVAVTAGYLVMFGVVTVRSIGIWNSPETFWTRVVEMQPTGVSYFERGKFYHGSGNYPAAVADYTAAIRTAGNTWRPYLYNLYAFRGAAQLAAGHYREAIADLTTAISRYPAPIYYKFRGAAYQALHQEAQAADDAGKAVNAPESLEWYLENGKTWGGPL
jgi:tetratricopeptide (TPR) repeat protein